MEFGTQDAGASAQGLLPSIPVLPQFGFQTSKLPLFALASLSWVSGPGRKIPKSANGVEEAGGREGGLSLGHQRSECVQLSPEDRPGCLQTEAGVRAGVPGASLHRQSHSRSAVTGGVGQAGQGEGAEDARRWGRAPETLTRRVSHSLGQECPLVSP